jgi:quinoprotein glucose dehydrogenase
LRDTNGDLKADFREAVHTGFGVHIAFGGHDMHGLKIGPDGKLYWSIADRGSQVTTREGKQIDLPDTGAIFRCNLDGSEMEVVASGLRNPQELAFDEFGNLWTGDNNADGGDKARWVYVMEGGDCGWRIGWQWLPKLGPWNSEKLWYEHGENTGAYILPPVGHVGRGPAGIAYYPGTGMPDEFAKTFLMCDFPGGIRAFSVKSKGAGFEVANDRQLVWEMNPVDVDFGPGGGIYIADWVYGWEKTGKGRIFRVFDPGMEKNPASMETKRLLAEGMLNRSMPELVKLLDHADMRVRQEAQFELVDRQEENTLEATANSGESQQQRLHAIWGLGQICRSSRNVPSVLLKLLTDPAAEVRAQSAKVLGDLRAKPARSGIEKLLGDSSLRVQSFAAIALGKIGDPKSLAPLITTIEHNDNRDPWLRHATVMGLQGVVRPEDLKRLISHKSGAVRLAAALVMRRSGDPQIAKFLEDSDPLIAVEAVRSINDVPINNAMPALVKISGRKDLPDFATRRVLNAAFRTGGEMGAGILSDFAADSTRPTALREEALQMLGDWAAPGGRDRIVGLWRPLAARDSTIAANAISKHWGQLFMKNSESIHLAAVRAAGALKIVPASYFLEVTTNGVVEIEARAEALRILGKGNAPERSLALALARNSENKVIRSTAEEIDHAARASGQLEGLLNDFTNGSLKQRQAVLKTLGTRNDEASAAVIRKWLKLLNDDVKSVTSSRQSAVPAELHLDVMEAAAERREPDIQQALAQLEKRNGELGKVAAFQDALVGGDADSGRKIFLERADAGCLRCHKIGNEGGDVGPNLTGVGTRLTRREILESIVTPNARIAPGFENVLLTLSNGETRAGIVKKEDARQLTIWAGEDGLVSVQKSTIQSRQVGLSPMPEDLTGILSKRDIRDLVEFLATSK